MVKNKIEKQETGGRDKKYEIGCEYCQMIFEKMLDGFALHEIICDEKGEPKDYRFLKINPSFEKMTGLRARDVVGKTVLEIMPKTEKSWISNYGEVALTGKPIRFENFSKELGKYFEVVAFSPQKNQFVTIFIDITSKKEAESEAYKSFEKANKALELMTGRELKMVELKNENRKLKEKIEKLSKK